MIDKSLRQAILESGRGGHWLEIIKRAEELDEIEQLKDIHRRKSDEPLPLSEIIMIGVRN